MYTFFYSIISEVYGIFKKNFDEEMYKITIKNMHKIGWKSNSFKYSDLSTLGHCCWVSKFPQFYDIIKNRYQILPHPYTGSYEG